MKELLLVLALLLAVIWLLLRMRRDATEREPAEEPPADRAVASSAYQAVTLRYPSNACDAAKAMNGRRFLSGAAPLLPLPGCNALECRCGFVYHSDRRSGSDRRSPLNAAAHGGAKGTFKVERRDRRDRRRSTGAINF